MTDYNAYRIKDIYCKLIKQGKIRFSNCFNCEYFEICKFKMMYDRD